MKKKVIGFSFLLAMIGFISVPSAYAYFTTYADAEGEREIMLGNDTDIEEEVNDLTKHIVIANNEDSQPVYIRVKVFWAEGAHVDTVNIGPADSNDSRWSEGTDGFWYYSEIVEPGQSTAELTALITVKGDKKPDFNVVVVSESTPVIYENNSPRPMDWELN